MKLIVHESLSRVLSLILCSRLWNLWNFYACAFSPPCPRGFSPGPLVSSDLTNTCHMIARVKLQSSTDECLSHSD